MFSPYLSSHPHCGGFLKHRFSDVVRAEGIMPSPLTWSCSKNVKDSSHNQWDLEQDIHPWKAPATSSINVTQSRHWPEKARLGKETLEEFGSFINSFPFQTSTKQKLEVHSQLQCICDLTVGIKLSKVRRDFNANCGCFVLLGK